MTNRERVLALIRDRPGLTDSEIRQRTGIEPHQQVNQICRSLAAAGLIERVTGPHGRIVNLPIAADPAAQHTQTSGTRPVSAGTETKERPSPTPITALPGWRPADTLLVVPCSGSKRPGSGTRGGTSILDVLPRPLAAELAEHRRRNATTASIDESTLLPAAERYSGTLYKSAGAAIRRLEARGTRVAIISGGYGLVLAGEPIGMYEQVFRPAMWPNRIIERCLGALAETSQVRTIVGVLSSTTGYATVFRRTRWPTGTRVLLASPEPAPGAMVKAPRAQGEWLATIAETGQVPENWTSSDGLHMEIRQLGMPERNAAEELAAVLSDEHRTEPPASFPTDPSSASHAGLYSWWADDTARSIIAAQLGVPIPRLIYAGQAGATRWPSGTKSNATLASRVRTNHISGNASSSTFRLTISAILLEPLGLVVAKPGRLERDDNRRVSDWIKEHLRVAIVPYHDRDSLGRIESEVLDLLDPPLNLEGRPPTDSRTLLSSLRKRITTPT